MAHAFSPPTNADRVFLWDHLVFVFAFLWYVPRSKHLHIVTAGLNVWLARTRAPGRLEPLRFDLPDEELRFGVATIDDLTRKEVVDAFSCTECGRCQDACPAYATGKLLSPKLVIMRVRDPRPTRGVHGRPGPPDGQRVRLPGVRRAERDDAERAGRNEDRRQLPTLLQHARERVHRLRRRLRGRPSQRAARPAGAGRPTQPQSRRETHHLPRLLLPRSSQRRPDGPARARRLRRPADRDEAKRQADLLLRRGRGSHVDGGARPADQRRAGPGGGRDGSGDPCRPVPVLT